MRLPRRVPWASLSEIEQVCSWIYSDETDINAISQAVGRVRFLIEDTCDSWFLRSPVSRLEGRYFPSSCTRVHLVPVDGRIARPFTARFNVAVSFSQTRLCNRYYTACQWSRRSSAARGVCTVNREHRRAVGLASMVSRAETCRNARGPA